MSRWGVLDMGSNTFLLLIAEWEARGRCLRILRDEHAIVRIGANMQGGDEITPTGLERAISIVLFYNALCNQLLVKRLWAVGTATFRQARNAQEVAQKIISKFSCPYMLSILTPQEEALYSYRGALIGQQLFTTTEYITIDVGGGSTELAYGVGWYPLKVYSLPVGAVRLWESVSQQQWSFEKTLFTVNQLVIDHLPPSFSAYCTQAQAYAVAGTPIALALMTQGIEYPQWWRAHGVEITRDQLENMVAYLWHMSLDERRKLISIHPERADILPAGSLILLELMRVLGIQSLRVSIYGLRYGVLLELLHREERFAFHLPFSLDDPRITQ